MKTSLAVFTAITLSTILSACGGGSSSQPNNSTRPTPTVTPAATPTPTSTSTATPVATPTATPAPAATPTPSPAPVKSVFEGVFDRPGYGQVLTITSNSTGFDTKEFNYTKNNCMVISSEQGSLKQITDLLLLKNNNVDLEVKRDGDLFSLPLRYKRIEKLPETCISNLLTLKGEQGYVFDANRDFRFLWDRFNEFHIGFERSNTNWDEIYSTFKPRVSTIENEEELLSLFSDMIKPLKDGHTSVAQGPIDEGIEALYNHPDTTGFNGSGKPNIDKILENEYKIDNPLSVRNDSEEETEKKVKEYTEQQKNELIKITRSYAADSNQIKSHAKDDNIVSFTTSNNIGYIEIRIMQDLAEEGEAGIADINTANTAIDDILNSMQDTRGIIIDVRQNPGGFEDIPLNLVSRFISSRLHVYSQQARLGNTRTPLRKVYVAPRGKVQYLKPVAILISNTTFSSAETFTLAMKSRPNVTLIGEASGGGFSSPLPNRVTSAIAFELSNQFILSPSNQWYENIGIPVDIKVPFATREQRRTKKDFGIERAISLLSK